MTVALRHERLVAHRPRSLGFGVLAVVVGGAIGAASAHSAKLGLAAAVAVLAMAVVAYKPVLLAVVAVAGTYASQRIGGASASAGGVSVSDVLLAVASFLALWALIGTPELRRLRTAGWGLALYLACLLPGVIVHQSRRADLEWVHRLVLVGGSLLVGAWIVHEDEIRSALRWLAAISCVLALAAILNTASRGYLPATPLGLNKNFIGALFAVAIVVVAVVNEEVGFRPQTQALVVLLLAAGLLASQSRGGILAAVCGLLISYALDPRLHSRRARALSILVALALASFAYVSVRHELDQSKADVNNSSIGVRFNVERVTREIWRTSPAVGVGLKYFLTGHYGPFALVPNNAVDNELAESGVFGLVGFTALQGLALGAGVKRRRGDKLVAVGVGVVAGLLLHGMVDIYWIAGSASLPFLILGMGLARPSPATPGPEPAIPAGRPVAAR